jgi:outer membrane cobalamin receptor
LGKGSGKIPAVQTLLLSYHFQRLAYTTPSRTENYRYQDLLGQWKLQYLFGKQSLSASLQFAYTRLSGDNLAIDFSPVDEVDRKEANAGLTHRLKTKGLILETSFRANYLQAFGLLPNGGINLSWSPGKLPSRYETFLHLHYGHRIPAFNELYYFGYGNSDLSPEKVSALEYGALYRPVFGNLNLLCKASGFLNRTKDKIITIPVNPVRWSTLSIGKTGSSGLELSMEAEWRKRYRLFVNYTLQKAVDLSRVERPLLPYTPREVLNYGFGIRWKGFEADISGQYSGWRFALLQNDASSFLSEYHILDAAIAWSSALGKIRMRIGVEAENMLDARYEVIRSYPMPAASYRLRIQLIY